MEDSSAWVQESQGVEFALSELTSAHAALDAAEASADAEVRRKHLAASRKAHMTAMRYLARVTASEEDRCALQALLRCLEVRMEKLSVPGSNQTAAA